MLENKFPPENRLHYRWEYLRFFKGSDVVRLPHCVVFKIPNDKGHYRLGVTVKAKCNSVERNRIKRRIRESFRAIGKDLGAFDFNVVVPGHRKIQTDTPQRIAQQLYRLRKAAS